MVSRISRGICSGSFLSLDFLRGEHKHMKVEWVKIITVKEVVLMVSVDVIIVTTEFQKLEEFL